MGVVIANFSKIEARLKALYVRFCIPDRGVFPVGKKSPAKGDFLLYGNNFKPQPLLIK